VEHGRAVVVPLVIETLVSVSVCLAENLHTMNIFCRALIPKLQKNILLSSCHTLRRFLLNICNLKYGIVSDN